MFSLIEKFFEFLRAPIGHFSIKPDPDTGRYPVGVQNFAWFVPLVVVVIILLFVYVF